MKKGVTHVFDSAANFYRENECGIRKTDDSVTGDEMCVKFDNLPLMETVRNGQNCYKFDQENEDFIKLTQVFDSAEYVKGTVVHPFSHVFVHKDLTLGRSDFDT